MRAGEPIAEVETDKTNVEIEAPASGVVRTIHVAAGTEGLESGVLLALIVDGTDQAEGETRTPVVTTSAPVPDDDQRGDTDPGGAVAESRSGPIQFPTPVADGAPTPVATPIARRMAAVAGLDLSAIGGTGRGGRIGKVDIDRALATQRARTSVASERAGAQEPAIVETHALVGSDRPFQEQPLTAMRRVTATRMQQAKQTVPHFYLRIECVRASPCRRSIRGSSPRTDW